MGILPQIKDNKEYWNLFSHNSNWDGAIPWIAQKHGLEGTPSRSHRGSHIVYRINSVWIKLISPLFARDLKFEIEGLECVQSQINSLTPKVLASGDIDGWAYAVLTHVEGLPIIEVFPGLDLSSQLDLVDQISKLTKSISQTRPSAIIQNRVDWNCEIRKRFAGCVEHHRSRNLNSNWLKGIPHFLNQFDSEDFTTDRPKFLHGDLTGDHFLVQQVDEQWKISGLIDFADCHFGHVEYEMIATIVYLFKGHPSLLKKYLSDMGFSEIQQNDNLSFRLMAWTLLHAYSNVTRLFPKELQSSNEGDFNALAKLVFPLADFKPN